ncbi:MAG: hypothetical protein ACK468_20270 [Dolichospermum sp.]
MVREQGTGNREQGTTELILTESCMATPRKLSKIKYYSYINLILNSGQGTGNREQGTATTELILTESCMATPRKLSKIKYYSYINLILIKY